MFDKELLPVIPEDAEINRASGEYVCETCGKTLDTHPRFVYPSKMKSVVLGCDGVYYHL